MQCPGFKVSGVVSSLTKTSQVEDHSAQPQFIPVFERPPIVGEADRRCYVVSARDPYGSILAFLGRSRYLLFQVATQLYSRGLVDPVPDPLIHIYIYIYIYIYKVKVKLSP
jgi:hypothetical protein